MQFNTDPDILFYLQNQLQDYLSFLTNMSPTMLAQIIFAATCTALSMWLLNKSTFVISKMQRGVYQSHLSYANKRRIGNLLKKLKPNSAWVFALLLAEVTQIYLENNIIYRLIFLDLIYLFIAYKLIFLICNFSIESAYASTSNFVSKSTHDKNFVKSQNLARYATVFFIPYAYDWNDYLPLVGQILLPITILLSMFRLYFPILEINKAALEKFISNQLPDEYKKIQFNFDNKKSKTLFVFLLIVSHLIKGILKVHENLLFIATYRKLTAKVLWMHLEQKQNFDASEEIISDERYELWFGQGFQPSDIIKTDNVEFFNKEFDEVLESWLQEKISENDLLLRGDAGIGKTIAIKNWLQNSEYKDLSYYIDVPPKGYTGNFFLNLVAKALETEIHSIDELIAFDKKATKHILIFDNSENFFLSTIGGFDCFKTILEIINLPLRNIFWVFVIGNESYIYLNNVFGRLNQYSYRITLKPWKAEEIRELIMSRHNASKRKLVFDDLLFASMGNNDELASYTATADRCFLLLAEQSNGNAALALNAWAKASSKKERFTIEIGLPEKPTTGFLSGYNADLLFIYASLIKHKNLTISEAAESTRQSYSVAQRAFKLGVDNGFLYSDANGRFYMHMYWQTQIINFLRIKNYLSGS